jgi:hypothetical protein
VKVAGGLWVVSSVEGSGASCAETDGIEGERREGTGTRSAEPWGKYYRIGYYLSSEKLKTVD